MDIDKRLRDSAPRTAMMTTGIEREIDGLAAAHAAAARRKKVGVASRLRNHRAALLTAVALVAVGGTSAAAAAPTVVEFFHQLEVERTSAHGFSAEGTACSIDWTIAPSDWSGATDDDPAVVAAREYLLSLDLSTITPDPVYLEAIRNAEDEAEGPRRSEADMMSIALMSTVSDLVTAEVKRQGLDEGRFTLHTASYAPNTTDACE